MPNVTPPASVPERRIKDGVIDQRAQQIDPAGHERQDPTNRPDSNTKQPGDLPQDTQGGA